MRIRWQPRVRTLLVLVAVCALGSGAWERWGPAGRWLRTIRAASGGDAWGAAIAPASGRVPGVRAKWALFELVAALKHPDPRTRGLAAAALAYYDIGAGDVVPALITAARDDEEPHVRAQAINSLVYKIPMDDRVGPATRERVILVMIRALGDRDPHVRRTAASSLTQIGRGAEALPVLVEALKDADPKVQRFAIANLKSMGKVAADARPELLLYLREQPQAARDPELQTLTIVNRIEAASVLLGLGEVEVALPTLERLTRSEDEWVCHYAMKELMCYERARSWTTK